MSVAPPSGQNRIMIYGPKNDGTYIVEFRTADGEALAISVPAGEQPSQFERGSAGAARLHAQDAGCRPRPPNCRGDAVVERHRRHAALGFRRPSPPADCAGYSVACGLAPRLLRPDRAHGLFRFGRRHQSAALL